MTDIENVPVSSNFDYELYDDEKNIVYPVVRVKFISIKDKEEWHILNDKEVICVMQATRFTKSERDFLHTADGMKFLIKEFKSGRKFVVDIKKSLKDLEKNQ